MTEEPQMIFLKKDIMKVSQVAEYLWLLHFFVMKYPY